MFENIWKPYNLYCERCFRLFRAVGGHFDVYTWECKYSVGIAHDDYFVRMHKISCEELRWFVLVYTAKLQSTAQK